MSTIKNDQISLYCYFNKIIKGPGIEPRDFTKAQKSRCLENKTLFFPQIKKFSNCTSRATLQQKIVL